MNKLRLSLTINKDIIQKIDASIDGVNIRNRSHAIELFITKAMKADMPKKAFILAGGKGTRLRPITYETPKPMILIKGRPLLEHTITLLRKYDVRDIIISIGYLGEKIKEYFGNGSKFGVNISYVEEKEPLGTAGPLKMAKDMLDSTFLMLNGDNVFNLDLSQMYRFHKKEGALGTLALTAVDNPSQYGVTKMNGTKIIEFIEKPSTWESNLINAGVYILEPEVLEMIPDGFSKIENDVFPKVAKKNRLCGYPFEGYWKDLGTLEAYEQALKDFDEGKTGY